ncbi:MAG: pilus assembly protein [Alphaproteobacteria bacterium]|nr:pilus assembly protein [Alphaproteobacteria bacterium]
MYKQKSRYLDFKQQLLKICTYFSQSSKGLTSQDGTALIEFAILAPIFIFLLIGLIELGLMLVIQNALDAGAAQAARYGMTGRVNNTQDRSTSINGEIFKILATYSWGLIDPSKVQISVRAYNTISDADNKTNPGLAGSFGSSGQTVTYTLRYPWTVPLPIFTNQTIFLEGSSITVNENFEG